jgi:pimeloyl-ACP methyl ester carboxylesterase
MTALDTADDTADYADVNGATIYYQDRGAGIPVVLIHGGFTSSARWAPVIPLLGDGIRAITPDSRAHGRSDNPSGELSYTQLADDVAALIDVLALDRPIVGGYSDGGQVTLEFGTRHPRVAAGLIVGAAYPEYVASGLRDLNAAFIGADADGRPDLTVIDEHLGEYAPIAKSRHPGGEAQWRSLIQQSARMWLDYTGLTEAQVRGIETPTLVYTGDRDELDPLDLMIKLYRMLPNAELAVCPAANHFAVLSDRQDQFAAAIRDFALRRGVRP